MTDALVASAIDAAHAAGRVLKDRFRSAKALEIETKGQHDFVTEVDRAAEAAALAVVNQRYPDHAVMSEEDSPDAARSTYRWVIDPLDGTTNFIHGLLPFCVSVGLEDDDGVLVGCIHDPIHDETFHAVRGGGAFLNGVPIRCTTIEASDRALIATGFPFRELSRLDRYLRAFEALVRSTAGIRRAGSAAIDLAYTACGRHDGFFEIGLSRWDIAAGSLLVREAGGHVTDIGGGTAFLDSGDIVAGGPAMHGIVLKVMRGAFD